MNIALGLNLKSLFLVYYSLNLVTDYKGGVQLYFTKRDQSFHEGSSGTMGGFESGAAEKTNPSQLFAFGGGSVTWGAIDGSDFRDRGTKAFGGKAVNAILSVGKIAADAYAWADPETGRVDPSVVSGFDAGYSFGGPITYGSIATESIELTGRLQLSGALIPVCRFVGLCGSGAPLNNPLMRQQPPTHTNPPKMPPHIITPFKEYPKVPRRWRDFIDQ